VFSLLVADFPKFSVAENTQRERERGAFREQAAVVAGQVMVAWSAYDDRYGLALLTATNTVLPDGESAQKRHNGNPCSSIHTAR